MTTLDEIAWPGTRLAEAVVALARRTGLGSGEPNVTAGSADTRVPDGGPSDAWIEALGDRFGVEIESRTVRLPEVEAALPALGPAILSLEGADGPRFLALLRSGRTSELLGPDLRSHRCASSDLRDRVRDPLEASVREEIEELLTAADVPSADRSRAMRALVDQRLPNEIGLRYWALQQPPEAEPVDQLRRAGLSEHLGVLVFAFGIEATLLAAGWWLLGHGALSGRLEPGWLWAWVLLLATLVPVQATGLWSQGIFTLGAGALLKRRLLAGALRSDPDQIRKQGAGQFLGRVIESESVETLALNGGFSAVLAVLELTLAFWVLWSGVSGPWHVGLLLVWLLFGGYLGRRYYRSCLRWTRSRLEMTHRLVERMVGQRTRLVQERRSSWHETEDQDLAVYLEESLRLDRRSLQFTVLVGRGWLLVSLLALLPAQLGEASQVRLAITLGGILLGYRALAQGADGFFALANAAVAWRQVSPLFRAAEKSPRPGSPALLAEAQNSAGSGPLLAALQVGHTYPGRARAVFDGWSLELRAGEQILLEGASGSGKSTLVALLAGLDEPSSGRVVLHGIDRYGWGSLAWRRRVAAAPQFHANHVFVGPLAFNLLLGRGAWPPSEEDLRDAYEVCCGLGLEDLIERMPAGLLQPVGESGWQLSHGERSRVFIARALLQGADVVILDESFAALDTENLSTAIEFARRCSPTLVVVAHPARS